MSASLICLPSRTSWAADCKPSFFFLSACEGNDVLIGWLLFRQNSPIVPGHEIIGRVAAVGDGVTAWKVGERVGAGWHGGHDGKAVPSNLDKLLGVLLLIMPRDLLCVQEGPVPDVRQPSRQRRDQGRRMYVLPDRTFPVDPPSLGRQPINHPPQTPSTSSSALKPPYASPNTSPPPSTRRSSAPA